MKHVPAGIALFTIFGAVGCANPSRVDALEANLARVRAEAALHDRKIEWLHQRQSVLADRYVQAAREAGSTSRAAAELLDRIAALQTENAALRTRLDRAEQRLDEASAEADRAQAAPARAARGRALDARVPYELASAPERAGRAGRATEGADKPPRRTLDETVPY